jgi:2-methylcitrate dehydratase PrpD
MPTTPTTPFAIQIADKIAAYQFSDLTPEALDNAKTVILDTVGCALAGAREPVVQTLLRTPGINTPGSSSLWGNYRKLDALCAALINGAAAHALDFDDVNIAIGGHPTAPVLAALQALAEEHPCDGKQFLLAFVVGFETETRIARSVNFHHYDKGWHPTATMGVFGAAAACAKLLSLSITETATALALCVSLASGVKANFGTMTKPYHVGHAARHGLLAARLAQQGFTANLEAFEHKQGFFNVYNGPGQYHPERALQDWAAPWDIVEPGIGIKLYPCCDSTHASIDALLMMMRDNDFSAHHIRRMKTLIHPLRLTHVDRPTLRNALDAKFSVQYCLARAALDKAITFDSFLPESYEDPAALMLMQSVEAAPHPDLSLTTDGNYLTELTVELLDGRTFTLQKDRPFGRTAQEPAPPELILSKFINCAASVLPAKRVTALHDAIRQLEDCERMHMLAEYWTP